ncbi:MAG TPA: NADP-dependent oxidoreductase [Candidatus Acidoferrum sp.]|nr:NADP-dependent oxidoreductase [Candidatus Acidoferrum sp.]
MTTNKQVLLASRPSGWVKESDFRIVEQPLASPGDGEVLVRGLFLSLDPYMRGRMNDSKSYAASVAVGAVMVGDAVSEVVESRNPAFKAGDLVVGRLGWQQYAVNDGKDLRKVARRNFPLSLYVGAVGMPGVTAWIGLNKIGQPKKGETVVVSAASGAVGSVVGQLAKLQGCRVVGIAGGALKCSYTMQDLGFDGCVDYKAGHIAHDLERETPDGIDIYFENVGGDILEAVMPRLNPFARIPLCGLISDYNSTTPRGISDMRPFLIKRVKLQGFICSDTMELWPEALKQLGELAASGTLKYRETVVEGIENAPKAFIGLFKGENFGKLVVKLA